jgi:hypothetical protein
MNVAMRSRPIPDVSRRNDLLQSLPARKADSRDARMRDMSARRIVEHERGVLPCQKTSAGSIDV